jgi:cobalamin biosynthesis Mg chelatase CobN
MKPAPFVPYGARNYRQQRRRMLGDAISDNANAAAQATAQEEAYIAQQKSEAAAYKAAQTIKSKTAQATAQGQQTASAAVSQVRRIVVGGVVVVLLAGGAWIAYDRLWRGGAR